MKKLIMRHSGDGYAVYFYCLELVAGAIDSKKITFEIEHDSEVIAYNLNIKGEAGLSAIDKVNNIMNYIVELGLFESSNNIITCFKLANRLESSNVRNPQLKIIQKKIREAGIVCDNPGQSRTIPDIQVQTRLDKIRLDKIRIDKIRIDKTIKETNLVDKSTKPKVTNKSKPKKEPSFQTVFRTLWNNLYFAVLGVDYLVTSYPAENKNLLKLKNEPMEQLENVIREYLSSGSFLLKDNKTILNFIKNYNHTDLIKVRNSKGAGFGYN